MYNVHLTHSLLCFEFVELTLKYKQGTLDMVKDLQLIDTNPLIPDMKIK